jgi:protein tyrosine/serine phosphatase
MSRVVPFVGALFLVALIVGVPWCYKLTYDRHYRNFHVVHDGVLYRSAQLDIAGLKHVAREYGIRTIVDLRDGVTSLDQEEAQWAAASGINHVRIPPRSWWAIDGPAPAEIGLAEFRRVMRDPANHPVLIHCFGGIHRTGTFVAIYRLDFQGWHREDAMGEMRAMGYSILDEHQDIVAFLFNHRPPNP